MNRKEWLRNMGLSGAALVTVGTGNLVQTSTSIHKKNARRVLRIAHITDQHVEPGNDSEKWMRTCLQQIHEMEDQPDIIFNGGDTINDALGQEEQKVKDQWKLWSKIESEEVSLPIVHCIGNHDVWGISEARNDPRYGKEWATDALGLENRYYSYEQAGWHFIVLDSTHPKDDGGWYTAKLDEEQFAWLQAELKRNNGQKPIMVLSHIPIVCAAAYFDGDNEESGDWQVPGAWMHIDARRIVELFYEYGNVKLCVSGHIHLLDKVVYNEVAYYCNGAISGRWWGGNYHQTPPGFAMINLYEDGSFDREYTQYGWRD